MTIYNFSETAGTEITSIVDSATLAFGSTGTLTDLTTNGSGQLQNTNNFSSAGVFITGANRSKVTLTTSYAGAANEYVAPLIATDASNQGYRAILSGQTGQTYTRATFSKDGSFLANVNFITPIDVSTGVVALELYLTGNDVSLDVTQGGVAYETLVVNDPAVLTREGSGFLITRESNSYLLEEWDDFAPATFSIDTPPAQINADTQASVVISNVAVTPTLGNTEVKLNNDLGVAATIDSITGTDPYTINFTFPKSTPRQFNPTGYPLYVEVAAENKTTSTDVPYFPPVGYSYTTLNNPLTTVGSILNGYTGDAPVTGDQVVYTNTTTPEDVGVTVQANGEWILESLPVDNVSISRYVIQTDDTVGTEASVDFTQVPVLSNPVGTATSETTADASVDTSTGDGTLYYLISQNATETANAIKISGQSQAVTATGTQNVSFTGLTAFTNYYVHFVQESAGLDQSLVVSTDSFTTSDTTAPVISSPTAIETGETTAFATVSTDEGNGTLYTYTSVNATELLATIKASGQTQPVSATGTQNITITGLTEGTSYYVHFVHADSTGNDSNIVTSAQFTTQEQGDTTPPVLTNPTATATGATTADTSVTTDEGNGIAYIYISTNPTENLTTLKASGQQEVVTAAGLITSSIAGLTASTEYYAHFLHEDASGNPSVIVTSTAFTTSAAGVDEPTITNIDGDNDVYPGQVVVITGTNFGTSVGTVTLDGVDQTVTHWTDTQITIIVVKGTMEYGGGKQLVVTLP